MARWEPMLEQVARERYPRLVAYAMLLTRSQSDAEDLVQDALVATFAGRARFATAAEAEAYVRRAVVSRSVDAGRRRTTERRAVARAAALTSRDAGAPSDVGHAGALAPELAEALETLSPRERACVVLRHMEDLSTRETASALRISEGAVKRYLSDGVARLSTALGPALGTGVGERVPVVPASADGGATDAHPEGRASGRKEGSDA